MIVTFDAEPHTYTTDGGADLPSVTRALRRLSEAAYSGVDPEVMRAASELGQAVHAVIELDCAGTLDEDSLHDRVRPYFEQWREFRALSGFEPILSEQIVFSERYGYAGKLDIFGKLNGRFALIDAKRTARVMRTAGPQTAGYKLALQHTLPLLVPPGVPVDRYALHLADRWKLEPFKDPNDERVFLAALTCHKWETAQ